MENTEGGIKRKSRLAVFEHVEKRKKSPRRKKFRPNRFPSEDSSPSDSELVIDDVKEEPKRFVKKRPLIKLSEERLHLCCDWNSCEECFDSWEIFNKHLITHASEAESLQCKWVNCYVSSGSTYLLLQHVSYHGYLTKLKCIGQNVLNRNKWPECKEEENCSIPITPEGYTCMWNNCSLNFCTIYDFYSHMKTHVHNNPRVANEEKNEIIECCWQGCNIKFSSKYKLDEHIRTHTKEKVFACPTCCTLFANKTKLGDHRKRQLATDLQSYQCSQCLKLFPTERLLRDHMRSHINHYKCTMCDMTCPKPSILAKHMRFKHIKFKPYKCPSCPKTFVAKHNLNTHLRSHGAEKPLKCDLCDFRCRAKDGMDNHYAKVHEKSNAVYECHCCKRTFKRGGYLTTHLMKVHNYHWPSGHTRFRYRKDQDGIHRLQTVRYESLEVTQEMFLSEGTQPSSMPEGINYNLKYDNDGKPNYILSVSENGEQYLKMSGNEENNILITIDDVDEDGNIIRSEIIESGEITRRVIDTGARVVIEGTAGKGGKGRKKKKTKSGKGKGKSLPVLVTEEEDVRHFSEDVILNYDKFKIETFKEELI